MDSAKMEDWAQKLLDAAAIFVPGQAAVLGEVLSVATELNAEFSLIKANDPAAWAKIVADNVSAEQEWAESIAAHPGS